MRPADKEWPNLCFLQADEEAIRSNRAIYRRLQGRGAERSTDATGRIGSIVTAPLNKEALNKADTIPVDRDAGRTRRRQGLSDDARA